ncbi:MAG: family 20 glycosylhydrolase, partial [Muribaculaceae bacterium]|nr:family 20 glycosylhydrolase [Muribaculaceae bacterium]
IEFVYRYEPDTAAVGLQGNLWCEYIPSDSHAEYMLYPRMLAIAENAWTEPRRKDYADFRQRALKESERMRSEGFTVFDLTTEKGNRPEALEPVEHLARGCEVTYLQPYWQNYPASGPQTLVDGVCGGWNYSDRLWQGFAQSTPERVDVIIDLGVEKPVSSVGATFMQICQPDVWMPERVEIYAGNDPENLVMLREIDRVRTPDTAVSFETFGWEGNVTARYVRYRATAPSGGVLFTDEIVVK